MARPRLITDEQILTAMRSFVLQKGPSVSLDLVAEKLGVTSPALIKRFGTRQNLMLAALAPPQEWPWIERHREADDRPLEVQLEELFTDIWSFFGELIPCMMALRESGIDREQIHKVSGMGPLKGLAAMTRWVSSAQKRGLVDVDDAETAAATMLGGLQFRIFSAHFTKQSMATRFHRHHLKSLASFFAGALAPRAIRNKPRQAARA